MQALNAEQSKLIVVLQQNLSDANARVTQEHEAAVQQAALIASLQVLSKLLIFSPPKHFLTHIFCVVTGTVTQC
jgi:hypothetical protein